MKILAISIKTRVLLSIAGTGPFLLERKRKGEDWKVFTADGYVLPEAKEEEKGQDDEAKAEVTGPSPLPENKIIEESGKENKLDDSGEELESIDASDSGESNEDEPDAKEILPEGNEEDTIPGKQAVTPLPINAGDIVDTAVEDGLYQYRISQYPQSETERPNEIEYQYTSWVICGTTGPIGYSFNNYEPAEGEWGDVIAPDDLRFTYLWGTDLKAANGQTYTDEQIRYFIKTSMEAIGRELEITIEKKRIKTNARGRNLKKNVDYDINEDFYRFNFDKISRYALITTKLRPIITVDRVALVGRLGMNYDMADYVVDYEKGAIKLLKRPMKPSATHRGINQAIGMYGTETYNPYLFYEVDYEAGYESAVDVPWDLREIVAKHAAVSMLNVIGDGLMSGFSSSSLSMDGMSESFSSTQSATSAYFGARIKEYKDDIANYIKANKRKFNNLPMGCI